MFPSEEEMVVNTHQQKLKLYSNAFGRTQEEAKMLFRDERGCIMRFVFKPLPG